ncbi:unnamed protein product [Caenorhabditis auriculariae]|uniref:FHA domain-containing protein n=1 Tax=Caenorhabditis auriculariae TaxID=2777116 RepID=A0A8S1HSI7_9PELO|nr:unnamed protein product [Caenorhabditis auriculariae]
MDESVKPPSEHTTRESSPVADIPKTETEPSVDQPQLKLVSYASTSESDNLDTSMDVSMNEEPKEEKKVDLEVPLEVDPVVEKQESETQESAVPHEENPEKDDSSTKEAVVEEEKAELSVKVEEKPEKASSHSPEPETFEKTGPPMRKRAHSDAKAVIASLPGAEEEPRIRRTTREIKRPKFDDELVDSGIKYSPVKAKRSLTGVPAVVGARSHSNSESVEVQQRSNSSSSNGTNSEKGETPESSTPTPTIRERIPSISKSRASKKEPSKGEKNQEDASVPSHSKADSKISLKKRIATSTDEKQTSEATGGEETVAKPEVRRKIANKDIRSKEVAAATEAAESMANDDLRAWTVTDDVSLITAATHVGDLTAVYQNVRFSQPFSLTDVEERWYKLLYNEPFSKLARKRISELTPEDLLRIQSRTAFTKEEEMVLAGIPANPLPTLQILEALLKEHREKFHSARTPQILHDHWHRMKQNNLLTQFVLLEYQPPIDWERVERSTELNNDLCFDYQRPLRTAIARTRIAAPYQKVAVAPVTGIATEKFSETVIAVMKGRVVRFVVRTDKITIGRSTPRCRVDVDLSLEGPATKISRRQAILDYNRETNEFIIENIGGRPIFVEGKAVATNMKTQVKDNYVIEIANIRLVFKVAIHCPATRPAVPAPPQPVVGPKVPVGPQVTGLKAVGLPPQGPAYVQRVQPQMNQQLQPRVQSLLQTHAQPRIQLQPQQRLQPRVQLQPKLPIISPFAKMLVPQASQPSSSHPSPLGIPKGPY